MPNYYLCSIFFFSFFFFGLNTTRTHSNSEKTSLWSTLRQLLRKKLGFSFSFSLFDCLITLIGFCCVTNLAILTYFEDGNEINKESLLILFRFRYSFQSANSYLLSLTFYCLVFLLFTKRGTFVRGAKLSTTHIYNTQSSVKT